MGVSEMKQDTINEIILYIMFFGGIAAMIAHRIAYVASLTN